MSERALQEQISELSAKVTALIMLVEMLLVDDFAKDDHAAEIGEFMVKNIMDAERKAREAVGERATDYSLRVSETLSSLIDRAVSRAITLRSKKRPG
jgi:hypothetical protein